MAKRMFTKRSGSEKSKQPTTAAPAPATTPAPTPLALTLGDFIIAKLSATPIGGVRLRFKCETCGSLLVRLVGNSPFVGCPNGHGGLTAFVRPSEVKELVLKAAPEASRVNGYSGRFRIAGNTGEFKRAWVVSIDSFSGRKKRKSVRFVIRHDSVVPDGMVLAKFEGRLRLFERVPAEESIPEAEKTSQ